MDLSEYEKAPMANLYVEALNNGWLADKILFASAHPFVEQGAAIEIYKNMPISDETREKVPYKNAFRILGLK